MLHILSKKCSITHSGIANQNHNDLLFHTTRMARIRETDKTRIGKEVEKLEPSDIAGEM